MEELFHKFAHRASMTAGSASTFFIAICVIMVWLVSGSFFNHSDTWQLFINTGTTIVTFLMVFLIQNTQNRDSKAMHLKLDELITSIKGARNSLVNLEDLPDHELEELHEEFLQLQAKYQRKTTRNGKLKLVVERTTSQAKETSS